MSQPIKYVLYSHRHYDHISGGKPFATPIMSGLHH